MGIGVGVGMQEGCVPADWEGTAGQTLQSKGRKRAQGAGECTEEVYGRETGSD